MANSLPIILVPGLNCSPRLYAEQIPALWQFGPVTIADHRGDETMAGIARQILSDAPPRFALAGLSMGGYVALAIMREAPERVDRLALLDTGAHADTPEQSERRKLQIEMALSGRFAEIPDLQWPFLVHKNRQNDEALKRLVRLMAEETGPEAFVRQQRAIMTRPDSRPTLAAIRCPTLGLVGEGDQLTPPDLAKEIHGLVAASRLVVVPDCGHLSAIERPAAVTQALMEWMA
jgi:pimeloyl-ACP methyl ester carboxylesterase